MSSLKLNLLAPALLDPVSIEDLKDHLREDGNEQNALLLTYIRSATEVAQNITRRQLITATFEQWFPRFSSTIELLRSPLISVTDIKYLDANGVEQTLATSVYDVFKTGIVGQVKLAYNQSWPATRSHDEAVKVTYQAGYGTDPDSVPFGSRSWILMHAAEMYRNREAGSDRAVKELPHLAGLLDPIRIPRVA